MLVWLIFQRDGFYSVENGGLHFAAAPLELAVALNYNLSILFRVALTVEVLAEVSAFCCPNYLSLSKKRIALL